MSSQTDSYEVMRLNGTAVERLCDRLHSVLGPLEIFCPRDDITAFQVELSKRLHGWKEWKQILEDNASSLKAVVGEQLLYQREPYLRIARPRKPEDQVGIHRDTHYGSSDKEWVLWIALTNATEGAELRILPGSHLQPEEAYPWTQEPNPDCPAGSEKHWLGFRYAPKRMSPEVEAMTVPVSCRVGEAILFNCAAVHGQILNTARWTRISLDIRLVNALAEINLKRGVHENLYVPLGAALMEVA